MPTFDLFDRLFEHDAWDNWGVFDFVGALASEQLDRDFDIVHRTIRETLLQTIGNIET